MRYASHYSVLAIALGSLGASRAMAAGGSLGIPPTINGYPTNVGLLIIGHSTSQLGDYPSKLVSALNHSSNSADGRRYQRFDATHGGDGGFLWSRVSLQPADLQYNRVKTSMAAGAGSGVQWCQASNNVRWSCRRAKVEKILTGTNPLPSTGTCAPPPVQVPPLPNPQNVCSPGGSPNALMPCTYYDRNLPLAQNPVTQMLSHNACWLKMDHHLVLIQDTSNRSWPIDDYNGDGAVTPLDAWPASKINPDALPCGTKTGQKDGFVDVNCDDKIDGADGAVVAYAGWLRAFSTQLLDSNRYGVAAAEHVFISQKPLEFGPGNCSFFPPAEDNVCRNGIPNPPPPIHGRHVVRTPAQIASTPSRPYNRYYTPTVFWEYAAIDRLFAGSIDPRIHRATPTSRVMYDRSVKAYDVGLAGTDWTIPAAVPGRPTVVVADNAEDDAEQNTSDPDHPDNVGVLNKDHIHHNANGGWMMADIWFAGLKPYLQ